MRAILTNFGTIGDINPFIALALELRRHGHRPALAFSPNFKSWVESFGLDFIALGPDLRQAQGEVQKRTRKLFISAQELLGLLAPLVEALPQVFSELCEASRGADVLICGATQPAGLMVHEKTGIAFASVHLTYFIGSGTPSLQQASAGLINPVRARFGLRPLRNPLTTDANSPQLALYAVSRHLIAPAEDWPAHHHMVGQFFLDDEQWRPDAALVKFIEAGEPPVVITMGSLAYDDAEALTGIFLDALALADCRAIIQQGWGGLGQRHDLPKNVYVADYIPHHWLFPRAACVVHHGGAGTAASAFRAGVPSLFITHDPPVRAHLANELGCAGQPLPYQGLDAHQLGATLKQILNTPGYYQAAAELGRKIRAEQGLEKARSLIEQLARHLGLDPDADREAAQAFDDRTGEATARRQHYLQKRRSRRAGQPSPSD